MATDFMGSNWRTDGWLSVGGGQGRRNGDHKAEFSKSVSSRDQASTTNEWIKQVLPITILIPNKSRRINMSLSSHTCLLLKLWRREIHALLFPSSLLTVSFTGKRVRLARGLWQVSMWLKSVRVAPARRNWREPSHRNEDPTQPKINK